MTAARDGQMYYTTDHQIAVLDSMKHAHTGTDTHTQTHTHACTHKHHPPNAADVPYVPVQCLQQYVGLAVMEGGGAAVTCPDMACHKTGVLLDSEVRVCFKNKLL